MSKVNLELPSVIGMGLSGPTLAFLTATLFSAFSGIFGWDNSAYAIIMFVLSSLLAVYPTLKYEGTMLMKTAMWPIATVCIFASAWGASTGLSAGEEAASRALEPSLAMASEEEPMAAAAPFDDGVVLPAYEPNVTRSYPRMEPIAKTNFHGIVSAFTETTNVGLGYDPCLSSGVPGMVFRRSTPPTRIAHPPPPPPVASAPEPMMEELPKTMLVEEENTPLQGRFFKRLK